jgi:hypothetical protein
MGSLTEIYKQLGANYTDTLKATQDAQANAIALQNARRAQQERMDLKALYAKQPNPSFQAVGAIDPAFAIEQQKAQMQLYKDQIENKYKETQTGEIENKIDREKETLMSKAALPHLNAYEANKGKIPEAENHHRLMTGLSDIANQAVAGNWAPSHYTSMDPNATYESILSNVNKSNVFTDSQRLQQEASKAQGSQQGLVQGGVPMTPQMAHGSVEIDPATGLPFIRPPLRGNQPPVGAKIPENTQPPDANATPADPANIAKLTFYENMATAPDATAEDRAFAEAQIIKLSPKENFNAQPQVVINTPEQIKTKNIELKGEIAAAEKAATLSAEDAAAWKQTFSAFKDMAPITTQYDEKGAKISEGIDDIISKSYNSKLDVRMANIASEFGQHTDASVAEAKLQTIFASLLSTVKTMPGSQSNVELQQRQRQVGAVLDDPTSSRESKREAFHAYLDAVQRQIINRLPYSESEIDDLVTKGIMSDTAAAKYDKALAAHNKGMR